MNSMTERAEGPVTVIDKVTVSGWPHPAEIYEFEYDLVPLAAIRKQFKNFIELKFLKVLH